MQKTYNFSKKVLHIHLTLEDHCFNQDTGTDLPGCWISTLWVTALSLTTYIVLSHATKQFTGVNYISNLYNIIQLTVFFMLVIIILRGARASSLNVVNSFVADFFKFLLSKY